MSIYRLTWLSFKENLFEKVEQNRMKNVIESMGRLTQSRALCAISSDLRGL